MIFNSFSKFLATTVAIAASTFTASAAQALQLTQSQWEFFNGFVQTERQAFTKLELKAINPNSMKWTGAADSLEVYFINEGASYKNQLLFSANDGPLSMIFENVSSPNSILKNSDGPLALGEGKSLGSFEKGTEINFFLNSNGYSSGLNPAGADPDTEQARSGSKLLGADATQNRDGLQHMVAYSLGEWTLMGFEDIIGGGDLDYNDTVFVVRGVAGASVPESSAWMGVFGAGLVGMTAFRRRKQAIA